MAHTPGPWTACQHGRCKCKLVSGEHHPIAQIISGEWGDDYPNIRLVTSWRGIGRVAEAYMDRIIYGEIDEEVAQANACLIAAAPDLLKGCKALLDAAYDTIATGVPCVSLEPAIEAAEAAIAKAAPPPPSAERQGE